MFDRYDCTTGGADPCAKNPCLNGGTCVIPKDDKDDDYVCKCPLHFTGDHCETGPSASNTILIALMPYFSEENMKLHRMGKSQKKQLDCWQ